MKTFVKNSFPFAEVNLKPLPDKKGGFNEGQPAGLLHKTESVIQRVHVIISLVMTDVENKTLSFFSKLCTLSFEEEQKFGFIKRVDKG